MTTHALGFDYASIDKDGVPDFVAAKAAGARYVFVRGAVGTWADPTAARDVDAIRAAGLLYGSYLAPSYRVDAPSQADQVAAFAAAAGLQHGTDLAPAIDIEFGSAGIAGTGMTRAQLGVWIGDLCAAITAQFGCLPIIYTSARVLEDQDADTLAGSADTVLTGCPLWLVRYLNGHVARFDEATLDGLPAPHEPPFADADGWWIHQYMGDANPLPWMKQADLNRFNPATSAVTGTRRAWLLARLAIDAATSDPDLDTAIKAFQTAHALTADGVVGPRTFAALSWCP